MQPEAVAVHAPEGPVAACPDGDRFPRYVLRAYSRGKPIAFRTPSGGFPLRSCVLPFLQKSRQGPASVSASISGCFSARSVMVLSILRAVPPHPTAGNGPSPSSRGRCLHHTVTGRGRRGGCCGPAGRSRLSAGVRPVRGGGESTGNGEGPGRGRGVGRRGVIRGGAGRGIPRLGGTSGPAPRTAFGRVIHCPARAALPAGGRGTRCPAGE